ncbi:MAG TPA: hypothetical protein VEF72_03530 [Mycobacterium sp.]|nr:hypothetical protein [Mycobacterium sp.]
MSHLTRRLVKGLAEAYKREHPEHAAEKPSAEETEAAAVAALARAIYGTPPAPEGGTHD